MDDNQPPAQASAFALQGQSVLAIEGADAVRFAHAQFMSDVASLGDGHWQWSGWLTPKGRVVALFALLRFDAQRLWLLLPDADAEALRTALQRFVFRSKVALKVLGDAHVSGSFSSPRHAGGTRFGGSADGAIEIDMGSAASPRSLYVRGEVAPMDPDAARKWEAFDLAHGVPRLAASQVEQWTPQQLSLDRLHAYSVKKGCYPGQEIVARTHFLGQAKRGLVLFDAGVSVSVGSEVRDGERVIGTVVSAISSDEGNPILAVLPLDHAAEGLTVDGVPLYPRPLLEGLAR
jgi:folate-binding protein YgfZ